MKKFRIITIIEDYELLDMIAFKECTSIKDCDPEVAYEYDYAERALVDEDDNLIYKNDNMHGDPDKWIQAFLKGLNYANLKYEISSITMLKKDFEYQNLTIKL